MTNISKHINDQKDYDLAYSELTQFIGKLSNKSAVFFVDELLTESERIMLVKRFAAIMMFRNNYSPYRVTHTLSLSISTGQRLYKNYSQGKYDNLLGKLQKKETSRFMSLLEDLIMAQVSPRARARLYNRVI